MENIINKYGDKLLHTTGTHGADISSQRLDELDISSLIYALSLTEKNKTAIDIGCGKGIHSIRLALLGINVHLYDIMDISKQINDIKEVLSLNATSLIFNHLGIEYAKFESDILFDIVYSQRFIHYLTYQEAMILMKKLYQHTRIDGQIFISASGMSSELSQNYSNYKEPINSRFGLLSSEMAIKHEIKEPVCLYHLHELEELLTSTGFKKVQIKLSSFGNVKAIFKK